MNFTVTQSVTCDELLSEIKCVLRRLSRLALKPHQKLDLLFHYVLPAYYHLLICEPSLVESAQPA